MATVLAHSASFFSNTKSGAKPLECKCINLAHYRRRTNIKAPRKRNFLVTMTKYSDAQTPPSGVASAFADNVAMLSCYSCCYNEPTWFGEGSGGNNGRGNNGGRRSGDNGGFNDGVPRSLFRLGHALLGAIAITAAVAMFPAQSNAKPGTLFGSPASNLLGGSFQETSLLSSSAPTRSGGLGDAMERNGGLGFGRGSSTSTSTSTSPMRPRSKVMHVACKGSTLVVPLPADESAQKSAPLLRLAPWQRRRIVDAPIELSAGEVAIIQARQYQVRENVRV